MFPGCFPQLPWTVQINTAARCLLCAAPSQVRAGTWTGVTVGPAGTVCKDLGHLCHPSLSLPLPGKVPSPSQLSVTELPGDEVRLEWVAAVASGVLVYQITWTPLGEGKAHKVWGERTFPTPVPGVQTPMLHPGDIGLHVARAGPQRVDTAPRGGHPVPPLRRSPSRGTWARPSCPAWGGTRSMRSPSWPTTGTGPAVTPCPSATPPVGDPCSAPDPPICGPPTGSPSSP